LKGHPELVSGSLYHWENEQEIKNKKLEKMTQIRVNQYLEIHPHEE